MSVLPPGYTYMRDSELTPAMVAWAKQINQQTYPGHYGEIFHTTIDRQQIAGIVEAHTYTYDNNRNQIPCPPGGCHGVSLLHPPPNVVVPTHAPAPAPSPQVDGTGRVISFLILGAALFGTALSVATAIFKARHPARAGEDD